MSARVILISLFDQCGNWSLIFLTNLGEGCNAWTKAVCAQLSHWIFKFDFVCGTFSLPFQSIQSPITLFALSAITPAVSRIIPSCGIESSLHPWKSNIYLTSNPPKERATVIVICQALEIISLVDLSARRWSRNTIWAIEAGNTNRDQMVITTPQIEPQLSEALTIRYPWVLSHYCQVTGAT